MMLEVLGLQKTQEDQAPFSYHLGLQMADTLYCHTVLTQLFFHSQEQHKTTHEVQGSQDDGSHHIGSPLGQKWRGNEHKAD